MMVPCYYCQFTWNYDCPRGEDVSLTLKADVFPVRPKARTVQPAAGQPLINGLEYTHVDCLAIVHMACREHTHTNMQEGKFADYWSPSAM